jgi:ABC-type multidrug transport system fused ATPase/permease subunit
MSVRDVIHASLDLLSRRDRRRLGLVTLAQMSTAFMDLLGVLLIGLVTALSVSVMSASAPPAAVTALLDRLGLADANLVDVAAVLAIAAGLVLIAKSGFSVFLTRRVLRFLANRQAAVSGRLVASLLSQPLLQVQERTSQETAYALTAGVNFATLLILGQCVVAATEVTLLLVLSLGLLAVSPVVTVFTILYFSLIALALQKLLSGWAGRSGQRASSIEVQSYEAIQEALRTYREGVVSNRRGFYAARFQGLRSESAHIQSDLQFISMVPKYLFESALVLGAGLLAGSQLVSKDVSAALGVIAIFLVAGSRVVPSMLRLQTATITIRAVSGQAAPTLVLAQELSSSPTSATRAGGANSIGAQEMRRVIASGQPDFAPTVLVSHVDFSYPNSSRPALVDINFRAEAGSSVALVGPTGAGKSTLADVILGVLLPNDGEVLVGGLPPDSAVCNWPGGLAYVPQDVAMSSGSVRENVALGLPLEAIDDELVWDALARAHLAEFLRESRRGLDTVIGENGLRLSGGQRQRLGMARALYTRPKLLILDEATSALDAETEQAISRTLRELEGRVTTVTVAHRLATIRHCDLVVYLEDGGIVAQGSFETVRSESLHFNQQAKLLGL